MTETLDFESDQRLKLLTEALRAGPGSPEWRDALQHLQLAPGESEYQALLRVREHLASGKSYKEIRPGPEFTRKVIEQIDEEAARAPALTPNANWIAAISALVIVAVVGIVAWLVWPRQEPAAPLESLKNTYFLHTLKSASFDDRIDEDWRAFGDLQIIADHGLRASSSVSGAANYRAGGILWNHPLPAEQAFSYEASIAIHKPGRDTIVQLFITTDPKFDGKNTTTANEIAWSLKDGEANVVLPDGRVEGRNLNLKDAKQTLDVKIAFNQRDALVSVNRQRLWSGAHQLDPQKPRFAGVRFLTRGNDDPGITIQSVQVMQP